MGRRGISYDKKMEAVEKYKREEGSQDSIAREYGVSQASFQQWIANYEVMGPSGLAIRHTNNKYSVELKTAAVEAYLQVHAGIGRMLQNTRYLGDEYYPAIIDPDTFAAAQAERIKRAEKTRPYPRTGRRKRSRLSLCISYKRGNTRIRRPFPADGIRL